MAALAERRPKAVTAAWLPGCGPGALYNLKHAACDGMHVVCQLKSQCNDTDNSTCADVARLRARRLRVLCGLYPCGGLRVQITSDALLLLDTRSQQVRFTKLYDWDWLHGTSVSSSSSVIPNALTGGTFCR